LSLIFCLLWFSLWRCLIIVSFIFISVNARLYSVLVSFIVFSSVFKRLFLTDKLFSNASISFNRFWYSGDNLIFPFDWFNFFKNIALIISPPVIDGMIIPKVPIYVPNKIYVIVPIVFKYNKNLIVMNAISSDRIRVNSNPGIKIL